MSVCVCVCLSHHYLRLISFLIIWSLMFSVDNSSRQLCVCLCGFLYSTCTAVCFCVCVYFCGMLTFCEWCFISFAFCVVESCVIFFKFNILSPSTVVCVSLSLCLGLLPGCFIVSVCLYRRNLFILIISVVSVCI